MWCYCEWQAFHNFKQYPKYYWKEFSHLNQEHVYQYYLHQCHHLWLQKSKNHLLIMQYEILISSASSSSSCTITSSALIIFDMSTNMFYLNAEISASASSIIIMWFPPAPQPVLVVNLRDDVTPCETIFVNTCKDNRSEEISSKSESTFLWSKKNTLQICKSLFFREWGMFL